MNKTIIIGMCILTLLFLSGCIDYVEAEKNRQENKPVNLCTKICENRNSFYYKNTINYRVNPVCYCKDAKGVISTYIM